MEVEQHRYERAHARVQALIGLYIHAGWGIGLGVHGLAVFGFGGGGPWDQEWEERKMQEMMDKERGR